MSAAIEAELISSPMLVPRPQDLPALTHKQTKFVQSYLETRNSTESAKLAGYDAVDDNTFHAIGAENLRKPAIQAHLQHALKVRQISPDAVLAELGDIAYAPWKDFVQVKYGPNDAILDVQLKLTDKLKALELAGKYHKLWDKAESAANVQINLNSESLTIVLQQVLNEITSTDTDS